MTEYLRGISGFVAGIRSSLDHMEKLAIGLDARRIQLEAALKEAIAIAREADHAGLMEPRIAELENLDHANPLAAAYLSRTDVDALAALALFANAQPGSVDVADGLMVVELIAGIRLPEIE